MSGKLLNNTTSNQRALVKLSFRQGLVEASHLFFQKTGSQLRVLIAANTIVYAAIAHRHTDYLLQLKGVRELSWTVNDGVVNYCYLDVNPITGEITEGTSPILPIYQRTPPSHTEGLHWYDTSSFTQYVSISGSWEEVIRVYVCGWNGTNTLSPVDWTVGSSFIGSQIECYTNCDAYPIVLSMFGYPALKEDGTFVVAGTNVDQYPSNSDVESVLFGDPNDPSSRSLGSAISESLSSIEISTNGLTNAQLRSTPVVTNESNGNSSATITTDTTNVTGTFVAITVLTDAVFASLIRTNTTGSIGAITVPAGVTIFGNITGYQLTSGAVIAYGA